MLNRLVCMSIFLFRICEQIKFLYVTAFFLILLLFFNDCDLKIYMELIWIKVWDFLKKFLKCSTPCIWWQFSLSAFNVVDVIVEGKKIILWAIKPALYWNKYMRGPLESEDLSQKKPFNLWRQFSYY